MNTQETKKQAVLSNQDDMTSFRYASYNIYFRTPSILKKSPILNMSKYIYLSWLLLFPTGCKERTSSSQSENIKSSATQVKSKEAATTHNHNYTTKTELEHLTVYIPHYSSINLACGTMPDNTDSTIIFCAEAAFTGELLKEFKHSNIAGDHVASGKRYKGYPCKRNTGCFAYYKGKYKFLYKNFSRDLDVAAQNDGMGFSQEMMIHRGKKVQCVRKDSNKNEFRALCELDGRLCIIDSRGRVEYGLFIQSLLERGVTEALYLDMGEGWNYSWWRNSTGTVSYIHNKRIAYTTNWIVFYQ